MESASRHSTLIPRFAKSWLNDFLSCSSILIQSKLRMNTAKIKKQKAETKLLTIEMLIIEQSQKVKGGVAVGRRLGNYQCLYVPNLEQNRETNSEETEHQIEDGKGKDSRKLVSQRCCFRRDTPKSGIAGK